jgi:hypothetical protein
MPPALTTPPAPIGRDSLPRPSKVVFTSRDLFKAASTSLRVPVRSLFIATKSASGCSRDAFLSRLLVSVDYCPPATFTYCRRSSSMRSQATGSLFLHFCSFYGSREANHSIQGVLVSHSRDAVNAIYFHLQYNRFPKLHVAVSRLSEPNDNSAPRRPGFVFGLLRSYGEWDRVRCR